MDNQKESLQKKLELACWIAQQLFARKMGPGTTGNLSFLHEDKIYITAGGSCFGSLTPQDFAYVDRHDLTQADCIDKKDAGKKSALLCGFFCVLITNYRKNQKKTNQFTKTGSVK